MMGSGRSKLPPIAAPAKPAATAQPAPAPATQKKDVEPSRPAFVPPMDQFPTPQLLAQCQRDYTAAKQPHPSGPDGLPEPFPPPTPRASVFDPDKFKHIDEHARNAPLETGNTACASLVSYLIQPAGSDAEKLRSFFVWIANQGLQRLESFTDEFGVPKPDTPMLIVYATVLQRKAGGYSQLLETMCKEANIPCRVVTGVTVKGFGYTVGDNPIETTGSTYCLVYVADSWRLIDQYRGCRAVVEQVDADWQWLAGRRRNPSASAEYQLVYCCDDHYFLSEPEQFICEHFPPETGDQLLARPVSADEFVQMASLESAFFDLGLSLVNQPRCAIDDDSGTVVVQIGLPVDANDDVDLDFAFCKSKYNDEYNKVDGLPLERFVMMEYIQDRTVFQLTINLVKYGRHTLVVRTRVPGRTSGLVDVCEYLVRSGVPHHVEPFPERCCHRPYGLTDSGRRLGFRQVNDESALIRVEDGQATITFSSTGTETFEMVHRLVRHANGVEVDLKNQVRHHFRREQRHTTVVIRLPESGYYTYEIQRANAGQQPEALCRHLVWTKRGCADDSPFPKSAGAGKEAVGHLTDDGIVVAASHEDPVFEWHDTKVLEVRMAVTRSAEFSVSLERFYEGQEEDLTAHVYWHTGGDDLTIFVKFAKLGAHKLSILADGRLVYQYVVFVYALCDDLLPFPVRLDGWRSGSVDVLEPRHRELTGEEEIVFRLKVADAESVDVVQAAGVTPLERQTTEEGDLWKGQVQVSEKGQLMIRARLRNESHEQLLFKYMIVKENVRQTTVNELLESAAQFREKMNERKKAEADKEAKRSEQNVKKSRAVEEAFKKNRTKFDDEEKQIEDENKQISDRLKERDFEPEPPNEQMTESEYKAIRERWITEANEKVPEWQLIYEKLQPSLMTEKLRAAAVSKDRQRLEAAIAEARQSRVDKNELVAAQHLLELLTADQDLKAACDAKDADAIVRVIDKIHADGRENELSAEIRKARFQLEAMLRENERTTAEPLFPRDAIAEIRAMRQVQPQVHRLVQAFLLLHGEDEETTKEWKRCQALFATTTRNSLRKRVAQYDSDSVSPEIAARCIEILDHVDLTLADVTKMGSGVKTLFVMAKGQIESLRENLRNATPANVDRQREIFGRPPVPPERP